MKAPANYKFWRCRPPFRHSWDQINMNESEVAKPDIVGSKWVFIAEECHKCNTTHWKWVSPTGDMTGWRYDWPDGYRLERDPTGEGVPNTEFRIAFYRRVTMRRKNGG